jgi:hypothetical protein
MRVPADQPAVLQVLAPLSENHVTVRITNVSRLGLQLSLDVRLEPGALVKVKRGPTVFFGEVRYCWALKSGKFFAGVLIEDVVSGQPGT